MITNAESNARLAKLEQRFSELEAELTPSPEKEAFSILHAMIHEGWRRGGPGKGAPEAAARKGPDVSNLYKSAPAMQGTAETSGLAPGTPAPDFTLLDAAAHQVSLHDFKGQPVVLVFYPLDWSPACSDQLSLYQSELPAFAEHGAKVLGISVDSIYSHGAWAAVRDLTIPLLADFNPKGEIARRYRVYRSTDGFSERALFVIDGEGTIRYTHVAPELHKVPDIYELFGHLDGLHQRA